MPKKVKKNVKKRSKSKHDGSRGRSRRRSRRRSPRSSPRSSQRSSSRSSPRSSPRLSPRRLVFILPNFNNRQQSVNHQTSSRSENSRSPRHSISSISSITSISPRSPSLLRHTRSPSPIRQRRLSFGQGNVRSPRNSPIITNETLLETPQTPLEDEYPQTSDRQYRHRRWW